MMHQRLSLLLVLAVVSASALFSPVAIAQDRPAQPSSAASLPADADLDALLAARNWDALGTLLSRPGTGDEVSRKLSWLRTRMENGGGLLLAIIYAHDLWTIGSALKADDPSKDLRAVAALVSLYAYELITIDGSKCEDPTAPSHRLTQLLTGRAATLQFLKQQQPDVKSRMVDAAIALERKTAPLRKDDDLICRDGMDQMKAGVERGTQQEVPTTSGQVGKTVAVTPPPDWAPKFVSPNVYGPLQDKARANMRETLLRLVG